MKKKLLYFVIAFMAKTILYAQPYVSIIDAPPVFNYVIVDKNSLPAPDFVNRVLTLDFEDNFDGTQLNPNVWNTDFAWGPITIGENYNWCDPSEITVSGGTLKLGVNKNTNANIVFEGNTYSRDYAAGVVSTKQYDFTYGRYEIRCKVPLINQHWPAFWAYGGSNQELDIFEFNSSDWKYHHNCSPAPAHDKWYAPMECATAEPMFTWHSPGTPQGSVYGSNNTVSGFRYAFCDWDVQNTPFDPNHGCEYTTPNVYADFHNEWHTWSITFDPLKISWEIDGTNFRTDARYYYYCPGLSAPYGPFYPIYSTAEYDDNNLPIQVRYCQGRTIVEQKNFPVGAIKMYMILSNGLVKMKDNNNNEDYNLYNFVDNWWDWPEGFFEIDYCRYYRFNDCNSTIKICKYEDAEPRFVNNKITGNNVYLATPPTGNGSCIFTIPSGKTVEAVAVNEVGITGEFAVSSNSEFIARIGQCNNGEINRTTSNNNSSHSTTAAAYSVKGSQEKESMEKTGRNGLLKVYPNPATETINFSCDKTIYKDFTLELLDETGRSMLKQSNEDKVNVSSLTSGFYFLKFTSQGYQKMFKVNVQH